MEITKCYCTIDVVCTINRVPIMTWLATADGVQ